MVRCTRVYMYLSAYTYEKYLLPIKTNFSFHHYWCSEIVIAHCDPTEIIEKKKTHTKNTEKQKDTRTTQYA